MAHYQTVVTAVIAEPRPDSDGVEVVVSAPGPA